MNKLQIEVAPSECSVDGRLPFAGRGILLSQANVDWISLLDVETKYPQRRGFWVGLDQPQPGLVIRQGSIQARLEFGVEGISDHVDFDINQGQKGDVFCSFARLMVRRVGANTNAAPILVKGGIGLAFGSQSKTQFTSTLTGAPLAAVGATVNLLNGIIPKYAHRLFVYAGVAGFTGTLGFLDASARNIGSVNIPIGGIVQSIPIPNEAYQLSFINAGPAILDMSIIFDVRF